MATTDTVTVPLVFTGNVSGPASYAAGGFLLDLTANMSFVRFLSLEIETRGSLLSDEYEITPNRDLAGVFSPGKAVVKLVVDRFDKFSIGNVTGKPSGVTVRAAKHAAGETTGSSHSHTIDHDHPNTTSSQPTAGGDGVGAAVGGIAIATHTHDVDIPNFTGSTPAGGLHTHDRSVEYDHNHAINNTETDASIVEVTAGTNVSGTTWRYFAVGD